VSFDVGQAIEGITSTGNTYSRRTLVEGARAYRLNARIGRHKVDRIEALPKDLREIGRMQKSGFSLDIVDSASAARSCGPTRDERSLTYV
jgi:transposase